jgi:ubiquinone/menaquinone biosynthesis C-methylase UbiE
MKAKELYPAIFSRHAAAYDRRLEQLMARGEAVGRQRVIDLVEARPGMRILDLACGPGNLTARLAALVSPGGAAVGVDLAEGMIERARARRIPTATFEVMDIEQLEFADASFDAAACGHGLQFAPDLGRALREARRVLKGGGRLAASVPVGSPSRGVQEVLDAVIAHHLPPAPKAVDQDATRKAVSDPETLTQAALEADFSSARVETIREKVVWQSAEQLVALCASWWDCAARLDGLDQEKRDAFVAEAVATLRRKHPGEIETTSSNLVLFAVA